MRGLNPDQLRTFVEVVEMGSFTAAAKRLSLSQPAVSLQIRELESRCGIQLLERLGKKPFPTVAGRQLLVHARRILEENETALAAMRRIRDATGQQVRIGMTLTTLTYLARDVVRQLKNDHAEIDLPVELSSSTALADAVRNGNLDLAIVTLPVDETHLTVQIFHEDSVTGIIPEGLVTPPPKSVTAEMLSRAPFVTQSIGDIQTSLAEAWFRANGHVPHSFIEVSTLEACRSAVAAGLGVSIVPGVMAAQPIAGLLALPLQPPVTRQLAVVALKGRTASPQVNLVRAALLQCRGLAKGGPVPVKPSSAASAVSVRAPRTAAA